MSFRTCRVVQWTAGNPDSEVYNRMWNDIGGLVRMHAIPVAAAAPGIATYNDLPLTQARRIGPRRLLSVK